MGKSRVQTYDRPKVSPRIKRVVLSVLLSLALMLLSLWLWRGVLS